MKTLRNSLALFLALLLPLSARDRSEPPVEINGARLADNAYMDGDSFTVILPSGERRIFRLYWVDCAETDKRFPDRVEEQRLAFGLRDAAATLAHGERAKEYVRGLLLRRPFVVYTWGETAGGMSRDKRYYARIWVQTREDGSGSFLAENLVRRGLARIHGKKPPEDSADLARFDRRLRGYAADHARETKKTTAAR